MSRQYTENYKEQGRYKLIRLDSSRNDRQVSQDKEYKGT